MNVERAVESGSHIPADAALAGGAFYLPTVLSAARPDMKIAQEEVFGPVLSVFRWTDQAEVPAAANSADFGLRASVWTDDLNAAQSMLEGLEVGYVWINNVGSHIHGAPFGGRKQSGLGREESIDELLAYTAVKNVHVKLKPGGR
jgi:betaine-aldehyde dehydrogenase